MNHFCPNCHSDEFDKLPDNELRCTACGHIFKDEEATPKEHTINVTLEWDDGEPEPSEEKEEISNFTCGCLAFCALFVLYYFISKIF